MTCARPSGVPSDSRWNLAHGLDDSRPSRRVPAKAQQRVQTTHDYARAEQMLAPTTNPLVFRAGVPATWIADDQFWYRVLLSDGTARMIVVDPSKATKLNCATRAVECAALVPSNTNVGAAHGRRAGRFRESMSPDGRKGHSCATGTYGYVT